MPEESLIAIDVGNTNVHIGFFVGETLEARWSLKADTGRERDDYGVALTVLFERAGIEPTSISKAVIGSVVPPLTPLFESVLREYCSLAPLVVRAGTRTGVRLVYDPVFELGADRIAHAVAAEKLYDTPAIVVDFGTATTFDAVGSGGAYLGGAIAPGLSIGAHALWRRTAQLHRIGFAFPARAVGRNTLEAVQSGLLFGHVGMTKEMISRIRAEIGSGAGVIATGDHAHLISEHVTEIEVVDRDLALHGLRLIYERNASASTSRGTGAEAEQQLSGGIHG
ncbi:MAG TPA: type III pantothenate kinase [Chloroflexota bacterium]|jgi:type III pantothenate kinase|nr:type III pantothenate kinase [Chloroflexota bacterium]